MTSYSRHIRFYDFLHSTLFAKIRPTSQDTATAKRLIHYYTSKTFQNDKVNKTRSCVFSPAIIWYAVSFFLNSVCQHIFFLSIRLFMYLLSIPMSSFLQCVNLCWFTRLGVGSLETEFFTVVPAVISYTAVYMPLRPQRKQKQHAVLFGQSLRSFITKLIFIQFKYMSLFYAL